MPPFDEKSIISLLAPLSERNQGAQGLRSDTAFIKPPLLRRMTITADGLVQGVHYLKTTRGALVARKLLRVNLSDMAAAGATPMGYMLVAALPKNTTRAWIVDFIKGLRLEQRVFNIDLYGGDTLCNSPKGKAPPYRNRHNRDRHNAAVLSLTMFGHSSRRYHISRQGAAAGDDIYVSGTIGDSVLGLYLLHGGLKGKVAARHKKYLIRRYLLPEPRLTLGGHLARVANACMDVSDGLVGDIGTLCAASDVGALINLDLVPLSRAMRTLMPLTARGEKIFSRAMTGGDDYELLFTAPVKQRARLERYARQSGTAIARLGTVTQDKAVIFTKQGRRTRFASSGYRHSFAMK